MSKPTKIHWCYKGGFVPICGSNPQWVKIAGSRESVTCGGCLRVLNGKIKGSA